jgi:CRP-like cAMP-binding protein
MTTTLSLALLHTPLLAGLPADAHARLAAAASARVYEPEQVIALEGDPSPEALFVRQGLVRARQISLEGREHVLGYLGPGSCLNLAPALDGGPLLASLEALQQTEIVALPGALLRALLHEQAEFAAAVALALAADNRRLSGRAKELALHSVRARLAAFLLRHAEYAPPLQYWTQAAIAADIGTVRDVVGRGLRSFAEEGLIRREQGRLRIVDRARLEQAAHEE